MKILGLAHMCVAENFTDKDGKQSKFYNGPSPDEVALVDFACSMNFDCISSTDHEILMNAPLKGSSKDKQHSFTVYRKMDFNSDRKRMSVVLKDPTDGKIKLLIKGADSIIKSRLDTNQQSAAFTNKVEWFLDTASTQGLRTLLMGMKVIE
jgi:magnesium-transporting ATPase (P-type)